MNKLLAVLLCVSLVSGGASPALAQSGPTGNDGDTPVHRVFLPSVSSASILGSTQSLSNEEFLVEIDGDNLVVGDIVATGVRKVNGGCDFGTIRVRTTAPEQGRTRWLGIEFDPKQCRAVVNAKWEGSLEEGPQDIVKPLMSLLSTVSAPVPEKPRPGLASEGASTYSVTAAKTSEQHVFMYGYGGTWDKLTHKYGRITFSYNGQSATISSQSGGCQGSKPFPWYEWVIDGCFSTSVNYGPSSVVWRTGRGDYHCEPPGAFPCNLSNPDGYYHSLFDDEDGHADGTSHCTYWWSGTIVAGVSREILQGCS